MTQTLSIAPTLTTTIGDTDNAWDDFLRGRPGGHHVQTSMWAEVKATVGWEPFRVVAHADGSIVGGAQILTRRIGSVGRIGYVANGPVALTASVHDLVLDEIEKLARAKRIRHLTIQPPLVGAIAFDPVRRGYLPSSTHVVPAATAIVDLDQDTESMLASFHRKTRYNVRVSGRKGISVRQGSRDDLTIYHSMLRETATRQGFNPFPLRYYEAMWDRLHPHGHLRLAVAEHDEAPVSAQIAVGFGDTVVNKMSVWSGREGSRRPNEAIQWSAMRWAAHQGYRFYDLEGISPVAAEALLTGSPLPDSLDQTVTSFKLGFNGRPLVAPNAHDFIYSTPVRWAFGEIYPRVRGSRAAKRAIKKIRTAT